MEAKLKLFFVLSLVALLILIILSNTLPPKILQIIDITEDLIGQEVAINGQIISKNSYGGFLVLKVKDKTDIIRITIDAGELINMSVSSKNWTFIGKVITYEEELEIETDRAFISA